MNGDIVEIRAVLADGIRVRNEAGLEGRVTWSQMRPWRAPKNDPVMAASGYTLTPDTAQSLTRLDTIFAMTEGSASPIGNKAYTAMSRAQGEAHLIVSESHEGAAILRSQPIGSGQPAPTPQDVINHTADNLSWFAEPVRAIDTLSQAQSVERGAEPTGRQAQRDAARHLINRTAAAGQGTQKQTATQRVLLQSSTRIAVRNKKPQLFHRFRHFDVAPRVNFAIEPNSALLSSLIDT